METLRAEAFLDGVACRGSGEVSVNGVVWVTVATMRVSSNKSLGQHRFPLRLKVTPIVAQHAALPQRMQQTGLKTGHYDKARQATSSTRASPWAALCAAITFSASSLGT